MNVKKGLAVTYFYEGYSFNNYTKKPYVENKKLISVK